MTSRKCQKMLKAKFGFLKISCKSLTCLDLATVNCLVRKMVGFFKVALVVTNIDENIIYIIYIIYNIYNIYYDI